MYKQPIAVKMPRRGYADSVLAYAILAGMERALQEAKWIVCGRTSK